MEMNARVLWAGTPRRVPGSLISIYNEKARAYIPVIIADEDGDFEVNLDEGEWSVSIFHENGRQIRPQVVRVPDDIEARGGKKILFELISYDSLSQPVGRVFFLGLIVFLFALIGAWVWSHLTFPEPRPPTIASATLNLAAQANTVLDDSDGIAGNARLRKTLGLINERLSSNAPSGNLKKHLNTMRGLADGLEKMLIDADGAGAGEQQTGEFKSGLETLARALPRLAELEIAAAGGATGSIIWTKGAKLYVEIIFWALFGTLVRLIFVIHLYLRDSRFITQGIYQHVAMIVTVPLMTLVFVLLISMAKLTAEDSSTVLDFSDPRIIAGGSFLIAIAPWKLWNRLLGIAGKAVGSGSDN